MIGVDLDKYEVLRKIGEGGMATVYVGRHRTLNREIAIKVLHPHLSSATRNRRRFAREARAIEHLRHPNILEIFDYSGPHTQDCYIVTEYVNGDTLTSLMERQERVPSEIATMIGIYLCDALAFAHQASILHRDLKPENVMLRDDGVVKLMDFGIARFLDETNVTMTGALIGSPAFMSPEQAKESALDTRSDLFSLGTLLFFLSSGQLPFIGTNASLVLKKIIEGDRPMVADVAPGISGLLMETIEGLLQPDVNDRFSNATEVRALLVDSLREVGINHIDPQWSLGKWRSDPSSYEEMLKIHLSTALVRAGKLALTEDRAISALRLFNRALSVNAEDEEVLNLVQSLHRPTHIQHRPLPFAIIVTALVLAAGAILWALAPSLTVTEVAPPITTMTVAERRIDTPNTPATITTLETPKPVPVEVPLAAPTAAPPKKPQRVSQTTTSSTIKTIEAIDKAQVPPRTIAQDVPITNAVPRFAEIGIRTDLPADIWIDGARMGHTRQPDTIKLLPGNHHIVLRGEWIEDYSMDVNLKPGDIFLPPSIIKLTKKPAMISVPAGYANTCVAYINDVRQGTLLQRNRVFSVQNASEKTIFKLSCPSGDYSATFTNLDRTRREEFPDP
jgi:serine/threonine-protein kinase